MTREEAFETVSGQLMSVLQTTGGDGYVEALRQVVVELQELRKECHPLQPDDRCYVCAKSAVRRETYYLCATHYGVHVKCEQQMAKDGRQIAALIERARVLTAQLQNSETERFKALTEIANAQLMAPRVLELHFADAADEIRLELIKARGKHGNMASPHEGYAVILEELDELWAEVKGQTPDRSRMKKEALQVAAMALRFIEDVCMKDAKECQYCHAVYVPSETPHQCQDDGEAMRAAFYRPDKGKEA